MKRATITLLFFLTLSLNLSFGSAFASEHEQRTDPTPFVTEYLDKLRVKCNFGVKEFELMRDALLESSPRLINPLPKDEALILSNCYPYWDNFERILNKAKNVKLDYEQIITKVDKLINEIKDNEYQREEAHIKTENINIEMDFAVIPAGEYKNDFIGSFAISPDISIQTTPVTQYQWAKIMDDNPSNFKTGEDSRKVEINGKQIEMCPNKPVESVSYEMITEFIKKLSDQDSIYEYQLPSIEEYLAVTGNHDQTRGYSCLNQKETCHIEFSGYQYLGKQRVYSMLDNVLEFTRNSQERTDLPKTNRILFGLPYYSTDSRNKTGKSTSITKPIYYASTLSDDIGFRLIRYKKCSDLKTGKPYNLILDEKTVTPDKNYIWDQIGQIYLHKAERLDWMVGHKDSYSKEIQHTIDVLLKNGSVKDLKNMSVLRFTYENISDLAPFAGLLKLESLYLTSNNISDLTSLAGLVKLEHLVLSYNNISDLTPLAGLLNLQELYLSHNNISDLTSLAGLVKLGYLDLSSNKISDLTPLAGLVKLEHLELIDNNISDLTPLAGLVKLEYLDLSSNNIPDLTPLAGLVKLEYLDLSSNNISDLTPLANLTNLKKLRLSRNNISDIAPLGSLTNLEELQIDENKISGLTPLAGLVNLYRLYLNHNNISDLTPLAGLVKLRYLYLSHNNISDISPLEDFQQQHLEVNIEKNPINLWPIIGYDSLIKKLKNRGWDISY